MQLQVPWYVNRTWTSIAFVKGKQLAMPFFTQVADWKAFLKKATWPSWWHHSPNFIDQGISSMELLPTYRIIKFKKWKGMIFLWWNLVSKFWVILKNGKWDFALETFGDSGKSSSTFYFWWYLKIVSGNALVSKGLDLHVFPV